MKKGCVHNHLNFCLSFEIGIKVEAGAGIRGSYVLKNRGIIHKGQDIFMSFAKHWNGNKR